MPCASAQEISSKEMDDLVSHSRCLVLATAVCLAVGLTLILSVVLPPRYPQAIPAIPLWVTLIPIFKDVDQSELYRKYIKEPIQTHGAVKLFFASQWNVVIQRPQYLAKMFKYGGIYEKSGNQKKIPHSVLAEFLGDNIISSHGSTWKKYRNVIQPGLQRGFETDVLARNAEELCQLIQNASRAARAGHGILVQDLLQRYTIANFAQVALQTDFGVSSDLKPIPPAVAVSGGNIHRLCATLTHRSTGSRPR